MVKKIALVCGVALALSVLAVAVMVVSPGSSAKADSPDSAFVFHSCPDKSFFPTTIGGFHIVYCFDEIQTSSGNATAILHGDLVSPSTPPDQATIITGWRCRTTNGITFDTRLVVNPSGEVNGTCHFHG